MKPRSAPHLHVREFSLNKVVLFIATVFPISFCFAGETDSAKQTGVGYGSVAETLKAITSKPGVKVSRTTPDGWLIVDDASEYAVWSFTPDSHYAYPAVVKRVIKTKDNGDVFVEMTALCEAKKEPCDKLIQEFEALNERMRQSVRARLGK